MFFLCTNDFNGNESVLREFIGDKNIIVNGHGWKQIIYLAFTSASSIQLRISTSPKKLFPFFFQRK